MISAACAPVPASPDDVPTRATQSEKPYRIAAAVAALLLLLTALV
jgi:hypothetical protein